MRTIEKISQSIADINQANSRVINLYCEWVKAKGLLYILLEGNKTQKQLSLRTHLIKQTVNNIVKSMMEDGFVVLKRHARFIRKSTIAEDGTVCHDTIEKVKKET